MTNLQQRMQRYTPDLLADETRLMVSRVKAIRNGKAKPLDYEVERLTTKLDELDHSWIMGGGR